MKTIKLKIFFCIIKTFIVDNYNIESKDKVFTVNIEKKASVFF